MHNPACFAEAGETIDTQKPLRVVPWHADSVAATLTAFDTSPEGLDTAEVLRRLALHGYNRMPEGEGRSALSRFLAQFNNVLIHVLLAAAAVTALLGHWVDAAVILLVVLVNAVIGFIQEGRAERALEAISAMISAQASVMRDGKRHTIKAEELVPGDIVLLEAGDRVPADLRLLRARSLRIDEGILTGESVPVEKGTSRIGADAALGDRTCMAFSGSLVVAGQGAGVVTGTGAGTEIGRITSLLGEVETLATPLVRQMDQFARMLTGAILAVSVAVFGIAVAVHGMPWGDAFMAVVGLAVAAIPEGLPAVMTITLAIGVQRMAARNAIIRRLPAVETLGSVSVICSDKTGTLTRNEMMVQTVVTSDGRFEVTGSGYAPEGGFLLDGTRASVEDRTSLAEVVRGSCLCNDASLRRTEAGWSVNGDPMEGALVSLAMKAGMDPHELRSRFGRLDEIPFDAQHRFMASLHHLPEGGAVLYVKGAPERVIAMCGREHASSGERPLDAGWWTAQADAAARQGQRVLGIAAKRLPQVPSKPLAFADVDDGLTMLGLLGLIDPPRDEALVAVRECQSAGIRVKMITGDHAATAAAIAGMLGIRGSDGRALTGADLDRMSESEFQSVVRDVSVFARTSPEHKLRIVQALQHDRAIVVMTGDGVNDAPSLKQADVGVAMGRKGTEVAKEAAGMVLADDNFASIVAAVHEGRTVHDNLKKVISWTLPTNGGVALAIITAMLLGLTLPIAPVQILWINMITAATLGLTLAYEPPEPDVMRRPPRRVDEPILSRFLVWRIVLVSVLFVVAVSGMFAWAIRRGLPIEEARTIVVNTLVVLEIFYLFSVRFLHAPSLTWHGVVGTRSVLIGVGAVVLAQFAFTYLPPMQVLFHTRAVSLLDGVAIMAAGMILLLILEGEKRLWGRVGGLNPDLKHR
ncbi:cation-transporting P-type ATPase [Microvirga arsenatis]|uniref:HAD-IC family P-type ATPase n=1 Tax=Microvirga arsenatis TaxID=2692265 RepID=A0ABW9Z3F4_9HYPH|nr:cation-transporting P-type ATPase [Microvirga arsenatis]NBJ13112.1 HAD-IC family P-type ATPase [Microvirga arsenatis]NBJ26863.1 HAD-IC family P-type ATPase [Microvirga arsenatis]